MLGTLLGTENKRVMVEAYSWFEVTDSEQVNHYKNENKKVFQKALKNIQEVFCWLVL